MIKKIIIVLLVSYIIARMIWPKDCENFENYFFKQCLGCEECVYDPKVEELKNKLEKWFGMRKAKWQGHLDCLNYKSENVMKQIRMCKGGSSYTIDKEFMYICTVDESTGEYYGDNMLMHVILHETAHVICDEVGHTKKFDDIFRTLMDEAHEPTCPNQYQIYDKNAPLLDDYCGVTEADTYTV
jgi:hypothetical protein